MKKILFSILLIIALVFSLSVVSAHHYWDSYDYKYEKHVDPWGRTEVKYTRDSPYGNVHYYKSTSPGYHTARVSNYWGYYNARPYYSDHYYTKTYKTSYHPYYYQRDRYYRDGYWSWRY
ncbi:hypothetical protein COU62_02235 [Candidatus Pacearchaeota archaeon CG10_big_fil_rev_8_21_14_0_10_35_219]|nr:hypothetical protein [Candidatus Pacearchaeota archaeon]OIO41963.1 MAG: hypothetical protein AUJ63_04385 [Candidatus Pacearchaeota archaeon CG1_02_35_32]PIO07787.1 MAG: hypothetical protein COU62_02235 [Candidatus Pacearchaeota archaeon CG10_big_fil_rev_8_21_14_0_10_35_219]PIY81009.1 MAG: hypothetical protein COY79_04345 [Candidatus Pacearchaeota archaeon CG_4_10_14_0_8_um_filter_35_169]PIZ79878.1 MAG: hypothetical protein COY00_02650 [Candidatus Pacearchaeota archaeon CG_4_10_14_0_2_um_filt